MSWSWSPADIATLQVFLEAHGLAGSALPVPVAIGDGHSNLIYRLDNAARPVVLRRPPHPLPPPGANDLMREVQILSAIGQTDCPIPRIAAVGEAGDPFDFPFYIMDLVDGDVITTRLPERFAGEDKARQLGLALVDMLAMLHGLDWAALGLANFGRPEGFNARHLRRMAGLLTDAMRQEHPALTTVQAWLEANCPPESGATILHNDFRIGNLMWARSETPRLAAIFDWELATLGDPLLDLAYLVTSLPRDGGCHNPIQDLSSACLAPGFPDQAMLIERYGAATGRSPARLQWYLAMVNWKLAVLYAYSRGRGTDPYYSDPDQVPRFLAEAAYHIAAA